MAGERPTARYQLGGRIGGGGMAEVFEATLVGAEGFSRPVAVKRIQPALSSDAAFGKMFVHEARVASLLHHPNIAAVLDFDRDEEGRYFLVMELIRGLDLRQLLDTGMLPVPVALHIAAEMLRGLDYAHELERDGRRLGIVHRDISPHNVMISWDGAVKVVDFGIAKVLAATAVSREGTIKGKVAYMSPEQASAGELDGRTDVFAAGVVLHEMLVGERLFQGATEPEILARVLNQPIPRPVERMPAVPRDLDAVVMRMLERDREARFPSAHAALEGLLATSATSPRAALELEQLLAARFPEQAPRRRSPPTATPSGPPLSGSPAASPMTETFPATPAAVAARTPVEARPLARRRPWRAGVLVGLVAAAITVGALIARDEVGQGEAPSTDRAVAAAQDAGPAVAAVIADAAPVASASGPADAAPPHAAPLDAGAAPREGRAEATGAARSTRPGRESRRSGPTGVLHVTVDPWADVSVDGVSYGQTPKKIPLAPGSHRVVLRNSELDRTERIKVEIRSREIRTLDRAWQ